MVTDLSQIGGLTELNPDLYCSEKVIPMLTDTDDCGDPVLIFVHKHVTVSRIMRIASTAVLPKILIQQLIEGVTNETIEIMPMIQRNPPTAVSVDHDKEPTDTGADASVDRLEEIDLQVISEMNQNNTKPWFCFPIGEEKVCPKEMNQCADDKSDSMLLS
ncbi:hypothetical protein KIN20_033401 [Parelaphostrongylus tenuis]|uniref:Uncharacterized protein n=1 Tax=Parelaphostrongylus tenuis TaxID=148309 RepID=A0AAD5WI84_PARTN|nr:hypothetical protein KIN20_033401 [Parelaphostrongylus tenuis]